MSEKTVQDQIRRLRKVAKDLLVEGWTPKIGKYFDNTTCISLNCMQCRVGNANCPRPSIVGLDI